MSKQFIHGTAAAGSTVNVVDRSGQVLGVTSANANGEWSIDDLELDVGDHAVRAEAFNPGGRRQYTDWLDVSVEPELTAVEIEYAAMLAEEDRERTKRWEGIYCQVVEALADGGDVDYEFLTTLLGALGKSLDDLSADIDAMSKSLAMSAIHDRCVKAKLNSLGERHSIF